MFAPAVQVLLVVGCIASRWTACDSCAAGRATVEFVALQPMNVAHAAIAQSADIIASGIEWLRVMDNLR